MMSDLSERGCGDRESNDLSEECRLTRILTGL